MLNVLSTAGATILGVGYLFPLVYLIWSLKYGEVASDNPWNAAGLEWKTTSPPPRSTFTKTRSWTSRPYNYDELKEIPVER